MTGEEVYHGAAYAVAVTALRKHAADLGVYLTIWSARDDAKAQPDVRRAANHAMDEIGAALLELHGLRARLAGEIRQSDDRGPGRPPKCCAEDQAAEDTRRLDRVRVVLARFDWERGDRQLALEAIDRIVEGGQA